MSVELEHIESDDPGVRWVEQRNAWLAPRLPSLSPDAIRRWTDRPTWIPPGTIQLVRQRSDDGLHCVITTDRRPLQGFTIEYDLGLVHAAAQLGTQRLIAADTTFFTTPFEGELDTDYRALGYIEQAPLPMLDVLELRQDPATGQHTLVSGPDDPLYETATPLGTLGFIESYPINPRAISTPHIDWAIGALVRTVDSERWCHRYSVSDLLGDDSVVLGGIWQRPGPGFVALREERDGSLVSDLLQARHRSASWKARLRWSLAPLAWPEGRPQLWAVRAVGGRLRALGSPEIRNREPPTMRQRRVTLGYLRSSPASGWCELFSATHPALGDQYVTRSEIEATDMGYVIDGILGYVMNRFAHRHRESLPPEVKWASRFGQRRRYAEGLSPGDR
jgi:hypothetical protein